MIRTKNLKNNTILVTFMVGIFMLLFSLPTYAHCDSYAGPVIKDAEIALEKQKVDYVLKWINEEQETEIISLFNKTVQLQNGDTEVYEIVKKHFLETLVRLHRETEGEPFIGLQSGEAVPLIIEMADRSLEKENLSEVLPALTAHFKEVLEERYAEAARLYKIRNESVEAGRKYVAAYVQYTHTIEGIHDIIENGPAHSHSH